MGMRGWTQSPPPPKTPNPFPPPPFFLFFTRAPAARWEWRRVLARTGRRCVTRAWYGVGACAVSCAAEGWGGRTCLHSSERGGVQAHHGGPSAGMPRKTWGMPCTVIETGHRASLSGWRVTGRLGGRRDVAAVPQAWPCDSPDPWHMGSLGWSDAIALHISAAACWAGSPVHLRVLGSACSAGSRCEGCL